MNRRYFFWIILITVAGLFLTIHSMWQPYKTPEESPQGYQTANPRSPFKAYISAVGLVEASTDNINISTSVNRIVEKVLVNVGDKVKKGDPLFQLEDGDLQADLVARQSAYEIALAQLKKLESLPRSEDLEAAKATFNKASINLNEAKSQYQMVEGLQDSRALSQQEINRRRSNFEQAEAILNNAKADFEKIKAGTWKPDLEIAKLEVQQATANVKRTQADIQRATIRSPIDGSVLQVKIHEGELPAAIMGPLMIIGNTDELNLKVSINQFDAVNFRSDAKAVAYVRGNAHIKFPLEFVRLEPYLVKKQNLTNDITDKVDTQVLQVIYRIQKENQQIFIGQQMDVFIDE